MKKLIKFSIDTQKTPFAMLELARDLDGSVSFNTHIIADICRDSGIDPEITLGDEDNIAGLILNWYMAHLNNGGKRDPVADDLFSEALAEDMYGGGISHQPGRA